MSIEKHYIKSRPVCRVTFKLPKTAAGFSNKINVVGEFNNWDFNATPMRKSQNGAFSVTIDLDKGKEYQFLYLIDGKYWENDREADNYVRSPCGYSDNSIVVV
jgi:1,4-alpha-glucan branching enzyme